MLFPARILFSALGALALVGAAVRYCLLRALRRKFGDPLPSAFPYRARPSLVTRNELRFYAALRRAAGTRFAIAVKVRLADIITCPGAAWSMGYGRLIAQKHLDFVLCDPETLRIVLAFEVDDRTHERPDRRLRDLFVDRAMAAAGVPLVRVRAAATYSPRAIERLLSAAPAGTTGQPSMLAGGRSRPKATRVT